VKGKCLVPAPPLPLAVMPCPSFPAHASFADFSWPCRRNPVMSLQWLTFLLRRRKVARRRQIVCSILWIPNFLFPPIARVLLHVVTSRRTFRRSGRYVCIMLHSRVVRCLTVCTHLHSQQRPSASQPLPLETVKAGGKLARSVSPPSTTRETRSSRR
jgi:hypothetical protein